MAYTRLHTSYYLSPTLPSGGTAYRTALLNALTYAYIQAILLPGLEAHLKTTLYLSNLFITWRAYKFCIKDKGLINYLTNRDVEINRSDITHFIEETQFDFIKALEYLEVFKYSKVDGGQFKTCLPEVLINKLIKGFPRSMLLPEANELGDRYYKINPDHLPLIQKLTNTLIFIL